MKTFTGYGWIDNKGKYIHCKSSYEHIKALEESGCDFGGDVKELRQAVEDTQLNCELLSQEEGDWNAEWHTHEMACDDYKYAIRQAAYEKGFIRIGYVFAYGAICFEGKAKWIKQHINKIKKYRKNYNEEHGTDMPTQIERI